MLHDILRPGIQCSKLCLLPFLLLFFHQIKGVKFVYRFFFQYNVPFIEEISMNKDHYVRFLFKEYDNRDVKTRGFMVQNPQTTPFIFHKHYNIYNKGAFSSVQAYIYDSAMANATPTKLGSRGCFDLAALRRIFLS